MGLMEHQYDSRFEALEDHIHGIAKVYPTLANGVVVTAGAAWTLGAFVEIVPVSTITDPFDIHYICIEASSGAETFELVLYAATVEVGRIRFTTTVAVDAPQNQPFMSVVIPANTQIQAKVATVGGGDTVTMSIFYHTY